MSAVELVRALAHIATGFGVGYVIASLIESFMHHHVSDAPNRSLRRWQAHPRLLRYLIRTRYSHHIVHHRRTFKQDFVTQFRSDDERAVVNTELAALGAHGQIIRNSCYAVRLHGSGSLVFIAPLLPAIPVSLLLLSAWGTVGVCLALALPPIFSHFIHPYLHMPHEHAIQAAPKLTGWFLKRRYFRAMVRNHYMHHRYVACNYNLVLGGDLLRGVWRAPSQVDLGEMQRLGLPIH